MSEAFSSSLVNVLVQTHPALIPLLRSCVYYRGSLSMAEKWSVSVVESSHLWRSAVILLSPVWRPVLDHGGDGYVVDIGRCTRLIMVRSTRSMIVRDRSENRVSIVGGDVLGLCVELCRVIRGIDSLLRRRSLGRRLRGRWRPRLRGAPRGFRRYPLRCRRRH